MIHEDPETTFNLQLLHENIVSLGSFRDEIGRTIKIHDVFGGPVEYFFLMEWEDTKTFFSIDSYEAIDMINMDRR